MNRQLEQLYFGSPHFIQNCLVSVYGAYLHHSRYGGNSKRYSNELKQSQWLDKEQVLAYQTNKVRELVSLTYARVPYYREMWMRMKLSPDDIKTVNDLTWLPVVTKEELRSDSKRFIADDYWKSKCIELHTSGTTGAPLTILCSVDDRRKHYAFLDRFRSWHGIRNGDRRASFYGRIVVPVEQCAPPFWRYDLAENNYIFSSYHMAVNNLKYYYDKLKEIQPVEISGYPSSLCALAAYMLEHDLPPIRPKFLMTTAETLLAYQRATIEAAFCCKVRDQYGCTEMALFVSECEKGRSHINPEYSIVEILDDSGVPAACGEEGNVVCTSFINTVMPLIRYKIGDTVKGSSMMCECGRAFPIIESVTGRTDDVLLTPDGRPLGRMDPIFKGVKGIYETQLIQGALDELELKIVPGRDFSSESLEKLEYEIRKRIGPKMKLQINMVSQIPREKNGKFKAVIRLQ